MKPSSLYDIEDCREVPLMENSGDASDEDVDTSEVGCFGGLCITNRLNICQSLCSTLMTNICEGLQLLNKISKEFPDMVAACIHKSFSLFAAALVSSGIYSGFETSVYCEGEISGAQDEEEQKIIPIFERSKYEIDMEMAEIDITNIENYHDFATEVRRSCLYDIGNSLPHILWPWSPRYPRTDYFSIPQGREIDLSPLGLPWDLFKRRLQYVAMYPDLGSEQLIELTVHRGTELLYNLRLTRSVLGYDRYQFNEAVYFYYEAFHGGHQQADFDPQPIIYQPWPNARCRFRNAARYPLAPPWMSHWHSQAWICFMQDLALIEVELPPQQRSRIGWSWHFW